MNPIILAVVLGLGFINFTKEKFLLVDIEKEKANYTLETLSSTRDGPRSWDDSTSRYSFFKMALTATGLDATLKDGRYFTIFFPSNNAFAKIHACFKPDDNAQLKETLMKHIIPKKIDLKVLQDLPEGKTFQSIGGDNVFIQVRCHESSGIGIRMIDCDGPYDKIYYRLTVDHKKWSYLEYYFSFNESFHNGVAHGIDAVL